MTLPLWSTAGGNEPFVYVFAMIVITYGAVLLANSNLFDMLYGLYSVMMTHGTGARPSRPAYIETLSSMVLIGLSLALPIVASIFFYTARTAPYAATKNYRDTIWISFVWLYSAGAIMMASVIVLKKDLDDNELKKIWWAKLDNLYFAKFVQVMSYMILMATVLVGMSVNLIEIQPQNIVNPESIFFIINGILFLIYLTGSFVRTIKNEESLKLVYNRVIATGKQLDLTPIRPSEIKPGQLVEVKAGLDEAHIVPSDSDARLAFDAANHYLATSSDEKALLLKSGYAIRSLVDETGTPSYHMLTKDAARLFDTASAITPNGRAHVDDFEPPVLKTAANASSVMRDIATRFNRSKEQLQQIKFSEFNATFAVDENFMGVAPGHYFKMIMEEDTILLYVFYMLSIWLLTLRCSGTALQMWLIVHVPPMLYALAPKFKRHVLKEAKSDKPRVDRRDQWVYVQMLWAAVSLSMIGLVYKIFPDLANNDFYITRVQIWQFAENNDDFWWTGDSGGFDYHTISTVTILQFSIFSYFVFIMMTMFLEIGLWCTKAKSQ